MTAPYGDEDLVTFYETDNPSGREHEYYRSLAESLGAGRIIDLGCGTGLLTRTLTGAGRQITGVDPSPTMLRYARRQPGADGVTWIDGDARALEPSADTDLLICAGNAFMHIGGDELVETLRRIGRTLVAGGVLAFETRNPAHREWEQWTPAATKRTRGTAFGQLTEWLEVTSVSPGVVVFDGHNVFADGTDRVATSTLYFRTEAELIEALGAAGFDDVQVQGAWEGDPVAAEHRLLIVRAVTSTSPPRPALQLVKARSPLRPSDLHGPGRSAETRHGSTSSGTHRPSSPR